MFELVSVGMSASTAASVIDAINNGMNIVTALTLIAGLAGGAAALVETGLKALIKWAGKKTIIAW